MRLRVFDAPTMQAAMMRMREALGPDAMIVATQERSDGVRITAAAEPGETDVEALLRPPPASDAMHLARTALSHHGVPERIIAELERFVTELPSDDPATVLAHALKGVLPFLAPHGPETEAIVLVGPIAAGKTAAAARIAARWLVAGSQVRVITADTTRSGGQAQLAELLRPMQLAPMAVGTAAELAKLLRELPPACRVVIDTPGINAFRSDELAATADLVRAARAEPVMVLPAGLDAQDSIEIAANFHAMGSRRMLVTRLDAARRLGGIVAAAEGGLALTEASTSPLIGKGLTRITPQGLARLLLATASTKGGAVA